MRNVIAFAMCITSLCAAEITIPEGTKLKVRLADNLSSATAEEGQTVELTVAEPVKVGDEVVLPEGARVTGTVTVAVPKRRMGRAGKLDFSIDRAKAADGEWIPLRYVLQRKAGSSHSVRNGVITAGVAVAFWPAAPFVLLMRGKDVTMSKGVTFEVYTDKNHLFASRSIPASGNRPEEPTSADRSDPAAADPEAGGPATVTITSSDPGAEIELNGEFVGNTPSTIQVPAGSHEIAVRSGAQVWRRRINVASGSTISLTARWTEKTATTAAEN
jgi:hypothetical protein